MLTTDDLVSGKDVFFVATGITDGVSSRASAMTARRPSPSRWPCAPAPGDVRRIDAEHHRDKVKAYSAIEY